jgi:hypothetical protein
MSVGGLAVMVFPQQEQSPLYKLFRVVTGLIGGISMWS